MINGNILDLFDFCTLVTVNVNIPIIYQLMQQAHIQICPEF